MNPDIAAALDALLPEGWGENLVEDLCRAAREAMRRRMANSRDGGAILTALHSAGLSWREIEAKTGIPQTTARRWAEPPKPVSH